MYKEFGISEELEKLADECEKQIAEEFRKIEKVEIINSIKVLNAFHNNNLSEMHFVGSTGYGYNDVGRDTIEKIYRKYATHVPGFTGSERFKQIYEYLKIIPRFSLYEQDSTKGDFINMQKEKMYYSEIANQITSYVDDSDHKKRLQ